ncbi:MAG: uridylate kinase [Planctomycetes bacterium]|nr:uridylate kinase [Planctomycetota bacterium]
MADLTVYKIGGSLLDLPVLASLLRDLIDRCAPSQVLFVSGGGTPADAVRLWDRQHQLGERRSHDLALKAMDLSRYLLCELLPCLRPVRSLAQIQRAADDQVPAVLCADCFLKSAEAQGHSPLERSWHVTSDSIAAWTARLAGAREFVLVKSTPLPAGISQHEAAAAGLVDAAFPQVASGMPRLGWLNAREQPAVVIPWPQ